VLSPVAASRQSAALLALDNGGALTRRRYIGGGTNGDMMRKNYWPLTRLVFALVLEAVFLGFILPWCVKDSTYQADVWKDFFVACAAVLVIYLIWPVFRNGGTWLRFVALALCFLPAWLLVWVILQHFDLVPRWFS
jgi:hypothetical protein